MKAKTEIEDGRTVVTLDSENNFDARLMEDVYNMKESYEFTLRPFADSDRFGHKTSYRIEIEILNKSE